jgi:hypothetical protein
MPPRDPMRSPWVNSTFQPLIETSASPEAGAEKEIRFVPLARYQLSTYQATSVS